MFELLRTLDTQMPLKASVVIAVASVLFAGCQPTLDGQEEAATARIAVAANFADTAEALRIAFEAQDRGTLDIVIGSTGKLYAQIANGAPFDAFFAADTERPALLAKEGGESFVYALGRLALWSSDADLISSDGEPLFNGQYERLAVANAKLAPYGAATKAYLKHIGLELTDKTVTGQNISQTYQFVASENAELGFVAWSQIKRPDTPIAGSYFLPPSDAYPPIKQAAILTSNNATAQAFLDFVRTDPVAHRIIEEHGYRLPTEEESRA